MSHHCGVPHCLSNSLKTPLKKYFRVPRVVSNKGERERRLSTFRRQVWIAALARSRPDLSEIDLLQLEICQDGSLIRTMRNISTFPSAITRFDVSTSQTNLLGRSFPSATRLMTWTP